MDGRPKLGQAPLSREVVQALARKMRSFQEGLSAAERNLYDALIAHASLARRGEVFAYDQRSAEQPTDVEHLLDRVAEEMTVD